MNVVGDRSTSATNSVQSAGKRDLPVAEVEGVLAVRRWSSVEPQQWPWCHRSRLVGGDGRVSAQTQSGARLTTPHLGRDGVAQTILRHVTGQGRQRIGGTRSVAVGPEASERQAVGERRAGGGVVDDVAQDAVPRQRHHADRQVDGLGIGRLGGVREAAGNRQAIAAFEDAVEERRRRVRRPRAAPPPGRA